MLLYRLEREIIENHLIEEDEKVLVGVSGGPDSMALLSGLIQLSKKYGWKITCVHVDHQLREESKEDAQYVLNYCEKQNIPCEVKKISVQDVLEKEGGNLQSVARSLRYRAFKEVTNKWEVDKLALAHHKDDQVETVFMRFIRGTGLKGLMGIQMKRPWEGIQLIRPLLSFTKDEVKAYCMEHQLEPLLDRSNLSKKYMRNRLRLDLFPILNTYNPQFQDAVYNLSEIVHEEEKVWDNLTKDALTMTLKEYTSDKIVVNIIPFLKLPIALQRRTIKLILSSLKKRVGNETLHEIDRIRELASSKNPSAKMSLLGGYVARRVYETLHFSLQDDSIIRGAHPIYLSSGVTRLPEMTGYIEMILSDSLLEVVKPCSDWVVFDESKLDLPLRVRVRKKGDRMTCFGMTGTKKVKKVFIEEKVPQHIRGNYPIVTTNKDGVLWIPGVKRSNDALTDQNTKKFIYLLWYVK